MVSSMDECMDDGCEMRICDDGLILDLLSPMAVWLEARGGRRLTVLLTTNGHCASVKSVLCSDCPAVLDSSGTAGGSPAVTRAVFQLSATPDGLPMICIPCSATCKKESRVAWLLFTRLDFRFLFRRLPMFFLAETGVQSCFEVPLRWRVSRGPRASPRVHEEQCSRMKQNEAHANLYSARCALRHSSGVFVC